MNDGFDLLLLSSSPLQTKGYGELLGRLCIGSLPLDGRLPPHTDRRPLPVVIGLVGGLGAGKTTFTQGLARGLGMRARVTSPTFTLINEYTTPAQDARLYHVDSYRLAVSPSGAGEPEEALASQVYGLGLDELFDAVEEEETPHFVAVEWADHLADMLPADRLMVRFEEGGQGEARAPRQGAAADTRVLRLRAAGPRSRTLLRALDGRLPRSAGGDSRCGVADASP